MFLKSPDVSSKTQSRYLPCFTPASFCPLILLSQFPALSSSQVIPPALVTNMKSISLLYDPQEPLLQNHNFIFKTGVTPQESPAPGDVTMA